MSTTRELLDDHALMVAGWAGAGRLGLEETAEKLWAGAEEVRDEIMRRSAVGEL